jgi:SAM-dependent methyltransferase
MRKNPYWVVQRLADEGDAAYAGRCGRIYFEAQQRDNAEWWRRIGIPVELAGKHILEIGCGHGALCLDAAVRGAARVTGIDLDAARVQFACEHLRAHHPEHAQTVSFVQAALDELPVAEAFDVVLSKDTFEHVQELDRLLAAAARRLRHDGLLVCGFSPLYFSPNGDHARFGLPLPWIHAFLPQSLVCRWATRRLGRPIRSAADVGLNRLTLREFRSMLPPSAWELVSLRVNPIANPLRPLFDVLRRIPPLERFFTIGVYGVFRRRDGQAGGGSPRKCDPARPEPSTGAVGGPAPPGQAFCTEADPT